jgi:hypothetical protein
MHHWKWLWPLYEGYFIIGFREERIKITRAKKNKKMGRREVNFWLGGGPSMHIHLPLEARVLIKGKKGGPPLTLINNTYGGKPCFQFWIWLGGLSFKGGRGCIRRYPDFLIHRECWVECYNMEGREAGRKHMATILCASFPTRLHM